MPTPPLIQSWEGTTGSGTTVSAANTGTGGNNAVSNVSIGTSTTMTFDNAHAAQGLLSCKYTTPATFAAVRWDWTGLGGGSNDIWFRFYQYMTASPASQMSACGVRTTTATLSAELEISTGRVIQFHNAAGGTEAALTGTTVLAINQWVRIEFRLRSSATVGQIDWWLYNTDPEAPIGQHTETKSATGLVLGATSDQVRFGMVTTPGPASYTTWQDGHAVSTQGQIGPGGLLPELGMALAVT